MYKNTERERDTHTHWIDMGYTRALIFENLLGVCRGSELADPFAAHDYLFLRMLAAGMPSHNRSFLGRNRSFLGRSRSFLGHSRSLLRLFKLK
jgi:hypothetical protein